MKTQLVSMSSLFDVRQLPFLIRLVDDASPAVRERVASQLRAFSGDLEREIRAQNIALSPSQRAALNVLQLEASLSRSWNGWMDGRDDNARLETALSHLAQWQMDGEETENANSRNLDLMPHRADSWSNSATTQSPLSEILDDMALQFRATGRPWHPESLSAWLFVEKGLRGDTHDYYNARNSNLVRVVENGLGNPLSLSCLFVLLGARLDLDIRGCNFPGHFLAHARSGGLDLLFDCFDAGRLLSPFETNAIRKAEPQLLGTRMPPEAIVTRVLRNLAVAYEHCGDFDRVRFVHSLLSELEQAAE